MGGWHYHVVIYLLQWSWNWLEEFYLNNHPLNGLDGNHMMNANIVHINGLKLAKAHQNLKCKVIQYFFI